MVVLTLTSESTHVLVSACDSSDFLSLATLLALAEDAVDLPFAAGLQRHQQVRLILRDKLDFTDIVSLDRTACPTTALRARTKSLKRCAAMQNGSLACFCTLGRRHLNTHELSPTVC